MKEGDRIRWSFPDTDDELKTLRGKTFEAEIMMIDEESECYGVYTPYGQDMIPFKDDQLVITKPNNK